MPGIKIRTWNGSFSAFQPTWLNCCTLVMQKMCWINWSRWNLEEIDFGDEESHVEKDMEGKSDKKSWFKSFLTSIWIVILKNTVLWKFFLPKKFSEPETWFDKLLLFHLKLLLWVTPKIKPFNAFYQKDHLKIYKRFRTCKKSLVFKFHSFKSIYMLLFNFTSLTFNVQPFLAVFKYEMTENELLLWISAW